MQLLRLIGEEKDWNGSYQVTGGEVCVRSAYGCDSAPISEGQDPEPVALELLEKQVKRWAPSTRRETFRPGSPFSTRRR